MTLKEYWFDQYYRVYKIIENGKVVLSIDVHREGFPFKPESKLSLYNVELLYARLDPKLFGFDCLEEAEAIGLKTTKGEETISVRIYMGCDPPTPEIERIYRKVQSYIQKS